MTLAATVLKSHRPRARLSSLNADGSTRTLYDPDRIVLDGSVSYDRRREVRRTASVTVMDRRISPVAAGDEFAQGERLLFERGARIGSIDVFQTLGIYEVVSFSTTLGGRLSLSAEDPFTALIQNMGEVVTIPAYTRASEAIRLLWEPVLGSSVLWDLDDDSMTLNDSRTIDEDEDRLHAGIALAADFGLEVYAGRDGLPVMRAYADPATLPVARTYSQEAGTALATDISRSSDRRPFNRITVVGEPPNGAVVRAVANITDLTSPHHESRIGLRVAPTYRSAAITTQHQAEVVARARLIEQVQWSDSVVWSGVPDPTVEVGEVVSMVDAQTRTSALYRVESATIPIASGTMSLEATRVLPVFS